MKTTTFAAITAALCMMANAAAAQEQAAPSDDPRGVLRVGKLYSFGGGTQLDHGFGLDLRYDVYPDRNLEGHLGLFTQGQYELEDAWRFAGGLSLGWGFFGLELGVSHRTETATMAGSTGLHIGQSFTFGPLSIGGRVTLPLLDHVAQSTTMGVQGIEGALVVRVGWGFTVHGERRSSGGCHSRGGGGLGNLRGHHAH